MMSNVMAMSADLALPKGAPSPRVSAWGVSVRIAVAVSLLVSCVAPGASAVFAFQIGPIPPGTSAGQLQTNALGMKLRWCPPGTFLMGSPLTERDRETNEKQASVTLTKGFYLGQFEVTQAEWMAVMGYNPSFFSMTGLGANRIVNPDTSRLPVENLLYSEALTFCIKLTAREKAAGRLPANWEYRLPTEAQWEYACRAGTTTATAFGNALGSAKANVNGTVPYNGAPVGPFLVRTTPVGSYTVYANAWGFFDMHGNVYERCLDTHQPVLPGGFDPLVVPCADNLYRVNRGGSWSNLTRNARSAYRSAAKSDYFQDDLGLRVALVPITP